MMRLPPAPSVDRPLMAVVLLLPLFFTGCAMLTPPAASPAIYESKPTSIEYGKASFYGGRDIGRATANGERYHASNCTAAHKKLPFNTMVKVTNLKNGKSVLVRINDRGPFVKGRIIDLTVVAARKIEMMSDGIIPVRVEVLKPIEVIRKPNRVLEQGR
jgi:rare lipoprotein A